MINNNVEAILEWLKKCKSINSFLFFNSTKIENNNISIIPVSSENYTEKYIRSGGQKQFDFILRITKIFDENTSNINVDNFIELENIVDWIENQNKNKNFPNFKKGKVFFVETLESYPILTQTSENGFFATYEMQIRVKYYIF